MFRENKSILFVEDCTLTRFHSRTFLERYNYNVEEAKNGKEALLKIQNSSTPFDLIIVDIILPDIDGLELIKTIKTNHYYYYIPAIACSSDTRAFTIKRAIEAGVVDYICKPFNNEEFLQRIDKHLGQNQAYILEKALRNEVIRAKRGQTTFSFILVQKQDNNNTTIKDKAKYFKNKLRELDEVMIINNNLLALILPLTDDRGLAILTDRMHMWRENVGWKFTGVNYPNNGDNETDLLTFGWNMLLSN